MAALGLGTYGAHGFKPKNPSYKDVIFLSFKFNFTLFFIFNLCTPYQDNKEEIEKADTYSQSI